MFATFSSSMDARGKSGANAASQVQRPKRNVAARACDRCRTNRIKCDDNQPCKNCRVKGVECCKGKPGGTDRDVETLRTRVNELEAQLQRRNSQETSTTTFMSSQPDSEGTTGNSQQKITPRRQVKQAWLGFWKANLDGTHSHYYGPTSLDFFVHRMSSYLESNRQQSRISEELQNAASVDQESSSSFQSHDFRQDVMTQRQEEFLLNLFWQSYHSVFPLLDEIEFRDHYNSLWTNSDSARKPSALVDIILALCTQYSTAAIASGALSVSGSTNACPEHRQLFERSQSILRSYPEGLSALQCHVYSVLYLINASSFTAAHALLARAVHISYALGLQNEAPDSVPDARRLLFRRLWRSLFHLDSLLGLSLGRPPLLALDDSSMDLHSSAEERPIYRDIGWDSYHTQSVKLLTQARIISALFAGKCDEMLAAQTQPSLYADPILLETCASFLNQNLAPLKAWAKDVPAEMKLLRKENVDPFSTARCHVDFDGFAPFWLQRQRVLLELLYHHVLHTMFRTFIRFPSQRTAAGCTGPSITAATDGNGLMALNHAMATINIIHQTLAETGLLNSWHRGFQYLWEATVTVIGFTLSRPLCPFTAAARKTITMAVQSFDDFASNGITAAANAARIVRDLNYVIGSPTSSGYASPAPSRNSTSQPTNSPSPPLAHRDPSRRASALATPQLQLQSPLSLPGSDGSLSQGTQAGFPELPASMSGFDPKFMGGEGLPMDISADMINTFDMQNMDGWDSDLVMWSGEMGIMGQN
ncbi:hypothetical protein GQ43DRAFT_459526 [Delitschia confertaspora ATCC 74209]|uniref:Zn(2)-C6 fungal-type domain-containing protein n=1 Tax=Delitschia confertaspora ATCC 74209 TaxID=1513339 RepID=A0A9P4JVB8_9PLEO|nr:hypothetical protein GQ43DRAFT_459526 [Delitschia confertaspora ATCC 74209]